MNTRTWVGVVAAIIVLCGIGYVAMRGDSKASDMASSTPEGAVATDATSAMSLKELMMGGGSKQCTFSNDESGAHIAGTVYVSGGKVRGDVAANMSNGSTMNSHIINDGGTMYTWMDGMQQGFKMSIDAMASAASSSASAHQSFDPSKKMNYSCSGWTADESKFMLPSGITFQDMSAMLHGGASGSAGARAGSAAQCSSCDSLPAAQKSACRMALQCK